jgi:hypothetical protein
MFSPERNIYYKYNIINNIVCTVFIYGLKGINDLVTSNDGKIFVASSEIDGVYYSEDNGKSWKEIYQGLNKELIRCLAIDSTGTLFAGTSNGIYKLNQIVNDVKIKQNDFNYKIKETASNITVQFNKKYTAQGLYDIKGHELNYSRICIDNNAIIEKGILIYFLVL